MSCREHRYVPAANCIDCRTDNLSGAVTTLAADNARLCSIGEAADELAAAVQALVQDAPNGLYTNLRKALDAYKVIRNGQ